ncbi:MAG: hypothetical protein GF313_15965 [Caldithrix sp.]|nr:hypothetical protein [Caldithrix sp.]
MSKRSGYQHRQEIQSAYQKAGPYLTIAYVFIGGILFFGFVGYYIDQKSHLEPLFLILGVFLGLGLGFYHMIKTIQNMER